MVDEQIEEAKAALRIRARAQRTAIGPTVKAEAAHAAAAHFFEGVTLAPNEIVALYWPIREELDCRPLMVRLMDAGWKLCLPVTEGDAPLTMRLWEEGQPLYPSGFGTLAPIDSAPVVEPDVVLVPLLAFDARGTRLGYGKGYYDRTIAGMARRPLVVGLAFSAQQLEGLPRDTHDVPLDAVVTEAGVIRFALTGSMP